MVGTIGTAPAGQAVPTLLPGAHGGNMDVNDVAPGAVLCLPVAVPGGLLAIGHVPELQEALRIASRHMLDLLEERLAVTREDAFMLVGTCGDGRIGQSCEGGVDATARMVLPRLA